MYIFLSCVGVALALLIVEVATKGKVAILPATMDAIERVCLAKFGWLWLPFLATAAGYAIAYPFGLGKEFATFTVIIFMVSLFKCWASFGSDVASLAASAATGRQRSASWQASPLFTVMTLFGAYGGLIGALSFNWAA